MNEQAASVPPQSPPRPAVGAVAPAADAAPLWHLAWAVGVLAAGAGLLVLFGSISWPATAALAAGVAPGLAGYVWRPAGRRRLALLGLWTLSAAVAAASTGGVTGPFGPWCVMPLLAGVLIGAAAEGAVLTAAAVAVSVLVELSGMTPPAPGASLGVGMSAAGLLTLGGAAAAALALLLARSREQQAAAQDEQAWISGVMSDLSQQVLVLDAEGRPEAVFGADLPGLAADTLLGGLEAAAAEADRPAVRAAIRDAFGRGSGETAFTPAAAPERQVTLALSLKSGGRLVAVIRPAPAEGRSNAAEADQALIEAQAARKAAEEARDEARAAAAAKSRFLANMSHELRTPLNAIMGFSDIMRARMFGDLPGKYGEYAELIHESGRHLTDLISDVLDMSKIEAERYSLDREIFDVRDPVTSAMRLLRLQADEAGIHLRALSPPQPLMVDADRRALKQIVINLVSNALKFTPAGGSVTVTTQAVDGALELVVADTGVGIAPGDLERLGRPYEQAGDAEQKAQGTGLGLSLVKAFAGLHGGEMTIESELGEGAAVTVRLPVLHAAEAANGPVANSGAFPAASSVAASPEAVARPEAASIGPSPMDDAPRAQFGPAHRSAEVIPLNLMR